MSGLILQPKLFHAVNENGFMNNEFNVRLLIPFRHPLDRFRSCGSFCFLSLQPWKDAET